MDRFSWCSGTNLSIFPGEIGIHQQGGVRIYDGENKTTFDSGVVKLTTHRLLWDDLQQQDRAIDIPLSLITRTEEHGAGFMSSAKISVYLHPPQPNKSSGPSVSSPYTYVKFSFKNGGHSEFYNKLNEQLNKKAWLQSGSKVSQSRTPASKPGPRGVGIVGIERKLEAQSKKRGDDINMAFKDLDALMEKAKEMVTLADKVASVLEEKKGSLTDDETVTFKSYLLRMGIDNPVTRETVGSGANYHKELAKELGKFLDKIIKVRDERPYYSHVSIMATFQDSTGNCEKDYDIIVREDEGGMMALTDAYCRFNRARGMELVSPEDLVNASRQFEALKIPLRLRSFDSGVLVIQSISHSDEEVIKKTKELLDDKGSLTAEELASVIKLSVMLAKERLIVTEQAGKACRDDSVEGLRFYPNLFTERSS